MSMTIATAAKVYPQVDMIPSLFPGTTERRFPRWPRWGHCAVEPHLRVRIRRLEQLYWLFGGGTTVLTIGTQWGSAYERDGICSGSSDPEKRLFAIRHRAHGDSLPISWYSYHWIPIKGRFSDCGQDR